MALRLPLRTLRLAGSYVHILFNCHFWTDGVKVRYMASGMGDFGTGAGKGGTGGAGAVKESGGAFSKMEAAHEEMYFRKLEQEQLKKLRAHLEEEVEYHKDQIEDHKQTLQLQRLKEHLDEEIDHHEKAIREHQDEVQKEKSSAKQNDQVMTLHHRSIRRLKEAIERHKKKIQKLHHQEQDMSDD